MLFFLKSAQADLFDKRVNVRSHTDKHGVVIPAHSAVRHVRRPEPPRARPSPSPTSNAAMDEAHLMLRMAVDARKDIDLAGMKDRDLLATILGGAHAVDVADRLMAGRDSLAAAMTMSPAALMQIEGVTSRMVVALKVVQEGMARAAREPIQKRDLMSSSSALTAYAKVKMAHDGREQFRVFFLDKKNHVISDERMNQGTTDHAPVYPREVVKRALELDASAIILAHNHPSGDPTPSAADVDMTRQVVEACRPLRIGVHDHIVVGRNGVASFRALGLM